MSPEKRLWVEEDSTRVIIAQRLAEIALIQAGKIDLSDTFVATTKGVVPMLLANAGVIRADLKSVWGKTYPELFTELGYAGYEDFADAATPAEAEKGLPTRVWNSLGRYSDGLGSLMLEDETIDLQQLKDLYDHNGLSEVPQFGPKSLSLVERVLENRLSLQVSLAATSD